MAPIPPTSPSSAHRATARVKDHLNNTKLRHRQQQRNSLTDSNDMPMDRERVLGAANGVSLEPFTVSAPAALKSKQLDPRFTGTNTKLTGSNDMPLSRRRKLASSTIVEPIAASNNKPAAVAAIILKPSTQAPPSQKPATTVQSSSRKRGSRRRKSAIIAGASTTTAPAPLEIPLDPVSNMGASSSNVAATAKSTLDKVKSSGTSHQLFAPARIKKPKSTVTALDDKLVIIKSTSALFKKPKRGKAPPTVPTPLLALAPAIQPTIAAGVPALALKTLDDRIPRQGKSLPSSIPVVESTIKSVETTPASPPLIPTVTENVVEHSPVPTNQYHRSAAPSPPSPDTIAAGKLPTRPPPAIKKVTFGKNTIIKSPTTNLKPLPISTFGTKLLRGRRSPSTETSGFAAAREDALLQASVSKKLFENMAKAQKIGELKIEKFGLLRVLLMGGEIPEETIVSTIYENDARVAYKKVGDKTNEEAERTRKKGGGEKGSAIMQKRMKGQEEVEREGQEGRERKRKMEEEPEEEKGENPDRKKRKKDKSLEKEVTVIVEKRKVIKVEEAIEDKRKVRKAKRKIKIRSKEGLV